MLFVTAPYPSVYVASMDPSQFHCTGTSMVNFPQSTALRLRIVRSIMVIQTCPPLLACVSNLYSSQGHEFRPGTTTRSDRHGGFYQ